MSDAQTPVWLLGIETSGVTCAAALTRDGQLVAEKSANIRNIHSRLLAPFVEEVLAMANIRAGELAGIVLSAGPGSFTGLRIGYSLAKGLAHAATIPLIEVPTLDVWAYQSGAQPAPVTVVPVIDAHRGEIFCAVYRWEDGQLHRATEYSLIAPPDLAALVAADALLVGSDARKLQPQLQPHLPLRSRILEPAPPAPQLWALLALGFRKWKIRDFADLNSCEPFYMRTFKGAT